jgi:hypothetical protein
MLELDLSLLAMSAPVGLKRAKGKPMTGGDGDGPPFLVRAAYTCLATRVHKHKVSVAIIENQKKKTTKLNTCGWRRFGKKGDNRRKREIFRGSN